MGTDWVARGLAVASLTIGGLGVVVAFLTYRRNRPRLRLSFDYGRSWEMARTLGLLVVNAGHQPVTILQVQLVTAPQRVLARRMFILNRFRRLGHWWPERHLEPSNDEGRRQFAARYEIASDRLPLLLAPGKTEQFNFRANLVGRELYASVTDVLGRETVRKLSENERRVL